MQNNNLSLILSIIGCITGIASLILNFYKALIERSKLDIEFDESDTMYFKKLKKFSNYQTTFHALVYIRIINKSSFPVTVYDIESYCNNQPFYYDKYDGKAIELITKTFSDSNSYTTISKDMTTQIDFPLKIDSFSVFQGYIFFIFFPDINDETAKANFTIKTSRKIFKKSCTIKKFETKVYNTKANK